MSAYSDAIEFYLKRLCDEAIEALEGMPEEDLASWRPGQAHGEISTMYGMATHIAGAGEFWVLEAAGGRELNRNRPAEFAASGSIADLRARYRQWLADVHGVIAGLSEEALGAIFRREPNPSQGISGGEWTVANCIVHAMEHTAVHVGHLQIQRQLWDQEQLDRSG